MIAPALSATASLRSARFDRSEPDCISYAPSTTASASEGERAERRTAGMDVARTTFPNASQVTVAGSSAGGVGLAGFASLPTHFVPA